MQMPDFSKISLLWREKIRLRWLRIIRKAKPEYFGRFLEHLTSIEFIEQNHGAEKDAFGAPVPDGTYSLTLVYDWYRAYRRDRFFRGSLWPSIISAVVSAIVSPIAAYLTTLWLATK